MFAAMLYAFHSFTVMLTDFGLIGTPGTQPPVGAPGNGSDFAAAPPPPDPAPGGLFGGWGMLLIWGGIILLMYLLMFRPQRKREKKLKEMQASITTGDNVITNAGLFGRVADVGDDCFIIEFGTNRSIRIPILKSEVAGIRAPKMTPQPKETPALEDKKKDKEKEKSD